MCEGGLVFEKAPRIGHNADPCKLKEEEGGVPSSFPTPQKQWKVRGSGGLVWLDLIISIYIFLCILLLFLFSPVRVNALITRQISNIANFSKAMTIFSKSDPLNHPLFQPEAQLFVRLMLLQQNLQMEPSHCNTAYIGLVKQYEIGQCSWENYELVNQQQTNKSNSKFELQFPSRDPL